MSSEALPSASPVATAVAARPVNDARPWRPRHNPWLIAVSVTLATFMEVLDTSIANVALPHIAGNLSASQDESTWVLTSYLVSNAIVLPLSGWLSNVIGRKRFYMSCVVLFTLSSFLCGLAPSLGFLVVCRVLQGFGGGGLQPSEQSILADTFPPQKQGMAFAVYGMAVVLAPIIGPTLGGYITDNFNWRWIFFINIPVGLLSLFLTSQLVEDPPHARAKDRSQGLNIDYIGLGLIAVGLGFTQIILDKGQREGWFDSNFIIGAVVIAAIALVAAVIYELDHENPIVDLRLLRERNFGIANMLMFMLGFVLLGSTVLLPLFLQTMLGYTATQAGLALSPGGLVVLCMLPFVGFMLSKVQARWLIVAGLTITGISLVHMTSFDLSIDFRTAVTSRMFQSMGLALLFVPINTVAYGFIPKGKNNSASGLINLARNMGGSIGIATIATMLDRRAQVHQAYLSAHTTVFDPAYNNARKGLTSMLQQHGVAAGQAASRAQGMLYGTLERQATMLAFVDCFWILATAAFLMIPLVFLLRKNNPSKGAGPAH